MRSRARIGYCATVALFRRRWTSSAASSSSRRSGSASAAFPDPPDDRGALGAPQLLLLLLERPKVRIDARLGEQSGVRAALGDASSLEHEDFVRVDNGRKAMRDHER